MQQDEWETDITHDGDWLFGGRWRWRVIHTSPDFHIESRDGCARSKEKARMKAVKAQLEMGREDVHLVETA